MRVLAQREENRGFKGPLGTQGEARRKETCEETKERRRVGYCKVTSLGLSSVPPCLYLYENAIFLRSASIG